MSEIEQLKKRIDNSGSKGILTIQIRDDYAPAGDMMMQVLMENGEYIQRKGNLYYTHQEWRIYKKENAPY